MVQFPAKKTSKSALYLCCALAALFAIQHIAVAQLSGSGSFVVPLSDPQVSLGPPVSANGQVQLSLNGEPGITYVIESSIDLVNWTPIATNSDAGILRTITIPGAEIGGFYRGWRTPLPLFTFAFAARGNINLDGNGLTTDSFNSSDPNFSTNGMYDGSRVKTNGDIASVLGIVNLGNHVIRGNVVLSSNASFVSSTNQVLGKLNFNPAVAFPDVKLPNVSWMPAPLTGSTHDFITGGYYQVEDSSNLVVEAGVTVILNVTQANIYNLSIQIHGGITNSGTAYIFVNGATNAFFSRNHASDASNEAKNLCILAMPTLATFVAPDLSSGDFTGVIYAPTASVSFTGGGLGSGFHGSCIARTISVIGHVQFHFDEDLLTNGPCR